MKPDLVSMAKALSSAYMPIGVVLVSPEISDVIDSQSNKLGVFFLMDLPIPSTLSPVQLHQEALF